MKTRVHHYLGVPYVAKRRKAPATFGTPCTCGTCGRTWDDSIITSLTPSPSGRCPFEYMHKKESTLKRVSRHTKKARVMLREMPGFDPYDKRSNVVDALTNLMHYAAHYEINFESALSIAREHAQAEGVKQW